MPEIISAGRTISFSELRGFPDLFTAYCSDYGRVAPFYAADFRSEAARSEVADRRAAFVDHRDEVVRALRAQQERWGSDDATEEHLDRLADPSSVAVVTGQQIGLLGGPLFTIYKAITTLQLARRTEEETGRPAVPVFWMAGEDHDFDEVARLGLVRRNESFTLRYGAGPADAAAGDEAGPDGRPGTEAELPTEANGGPSGPVGRIRVDREFEAFVDRVGEALLETEFTGDLVDRLHAAYRPGETLLDGFARLLNGLFPDSGLILVSPDAPRLKELARPLFRRELRDPQGSYRRLNEVSEELEQQFHAQIYPRSTNLFLLGEDDRHPVEAAGNGSFRIGETGRTVSRDELLDMVEDAPERFSPNVALRPLMQDLLLPTAAYVGGPSEISYFAQISSLYDWAEIPMPVIHPRASVLVVEGKVRRVLEKYDLGEEELQDDLGALFKRVLPAWTDVDVEAEFQDAVRHLHEAINDLKPVAEEIDSTLVPAAEATRSDLLKDLDQLKDKFVRAEKRNNEEIRAQLKKAQVGLFPEGELQERFLSVLYFLNKYSPEIVDRWTEALSLDTTSFQVLDL